MQLTDDKGSTNDPVSEAVPVKSTDIFVEFSRVVEEEKYEPSLIDPPDIELKAMSTYPLKCTNRDLLQTSGDGDFGAREKKPPWNGDERKSLGDDLVTLYTPP